MVGFVDLLVLGLGVAIGVFAARGLWEAAKAGITLRRAARVSEGDVSAGDTVAATGAVFVDETAPLSDRLFDETTGDVGAYVWRAWFADASRYTYDFDRGEFRQGRNPFAAGVEAGRFGVADTGREVHVDPSWLDRAYDGDVLSELAVGNPVSNMKLPAVFTRHVFDAVQLSLSATVADRSVERLTDVVDLYREDVAVDEFSVESRGVPAGTSLFVAGELRVTDGEWTVAGTNGTPLLLSDEGVDGLRRQLWWHGVKKGLWLAAAVVVPSLMVFW